MFAGFYVIIDICVDMYMCICLFISELYPLLFNSHSGKQYKANTYKGKNKQIQINISTYILIYICMYLHYKCMFVKHLCSTVSFNK